MKTIGKYEILGLLGRGGMGVAYKVRLPVVGSVAALKLLKPSPFLIGLLGMEEIERRFTEEAKVMAGLRHHNIAGVRDFDYETAPENGRRRPFYVMEYYPTTLGGLIGESYRAEKPSRPLGVETSVHYARQTLEGLARLHHAGVVHRDVKPFNLMVCTDDVVKITDFGLSKLRGESTTTHAPDSLKIGTPFYCPPEQEADPESVDASADLYSAGVCLYRCLTGHLPVQPDDLEPGRFIPVTVRCPELTPEWDDFFRKATNEKPALRYQSARDMRGDLELLHAEWRVRADSACAPDLDRLLGNVAPQSAAARHPRSEPIRVRFAEAQAAFHLDELWRPRKVRSHAELLMDEDYAAQVAYDPTTGLEWQRYGSPYPMNWVEANGDVFMLNARKFAGHADWRLPTAEELVTLLVPPGKGAHESDYCLPPAFSSIQRRVWSADEAGFTSAWTAEAKLGFLDRQDKTADAWVRAVRTASA